MTPRGNPELLNHLDPEWLEEMLSYGFEYCLGRMSYAPSVCMDFLEPCLPYMQDRILGFMYRRINKATLEPMQYSSDWNTFKLKIERELQKRGWEYDDYAY